MHCKFFIDMESENMGRAKGNIQKNLSDEEMLKSFEVSHEKTSDIKNAERPNKNQNATYMDSNVFDTINEALLKLKLDLYKEGIVDYTIKVKYENKQVNLYAVPKKSKSLR